LLELETNLSRTLLNATALEEFWNAKYFTSSEKYKFPRFLQCVDTLLRSDEVKRIKMSVPPSFLKNKLEQVQVESSLANLFRVYLATHDFTYRDEIVDEILMEITANFGCLEFNPFLRYYPDETIGSNSVSFLNSDPHFRSSYLISENLIDNADITSFQRKVSTVLSNCFFFEDHSRRKRTRTQLLNIQVLLYELVSNILNHGRVKQPTTHGKMDVSSGNFWFLRIDIDKITGDREYQNYFKKRPHFKDYGAYLKLRAEDFKERGLSIGPDGSHLKIVSITVQDNGMGILNHFLKQTGSSEGDRKGLFTEIMSSRMTSTNFSGAGEGTMNALKSVYNLSGAISVRTNDMWCTASAHNRAINHVNLNTADWGHLEGTSYTILLPTTSTRQPQER